MTGRQTAWMGVVLVAALATGGEKPAELRVISVTGVARCYNHSHAMGLWCTTPRPDRPGRLPVRGGDILAIVSAAETKDGATRHEMPLLCAYAASDGASLSLGAAEDRLTLGGKTIAVRLRADSPAWAWLGRASAAELRGLRFLAIQEEPEPEQQALLTKLAGANPRVDLALGEDVSPTEILPLFRPRRLLLPETAPDEKARKAIAGLADLETLWIAAGKPNDLAYLGRLPALRHLVLQGWEPAGPDLLPWKLRRLHSLALVGSTVKDLAAIEHLTDLRVLRLMGCKELADLGGLTVLTKLDTLCLLGEHKVEDLAPLGKAPALRHLSLTAELDGASMGTLCRTVPQLESLELIGSDKLKTLEPLAALEHLRYLVVLGPEANVQPLAGMRHLRALVLPGEVFEKAPDKVAALEKALPETALAAGELCLGSGWLLLLLPALAAGYLLHRRRVSRRDRADA